MWNKKKDGYELINEIDVSTWTVAGVSIETDRVGFSSIDIEIKISKLNTLYIRYGKTADTNARLPWGARGPRGGGGVQGAMRFIEALEVLGAKVKR